MKILITENQLDNLIEKYIDSKWKDLIRRDSHDEESVYWFMASTKKLVIELNSVFGFLYVGHVMTADLMDIFGLSIEKALEYLEEWVTTNLDIYPVDSVDILNDDITMEEMYE